MSTQFGSFANQIDVQNAVDIIVLGGYVVAQVHGEYVAIFSGTDLNARQKVLAANKEENRNKPLGSIMFSDQVLSFVDVDRCHPPAAEQLLDDSNHFRKRVGSLCYSRLPLIEKAAGNDIPTQMVILENGIPTIQNLDPYGNMLVSNLIHELRRDSIEFVAASSLNLHGEEEISDLSSAKAFCEEAGAPYLLEDPLYLRPKIRGSFPVVDLVRMAALRDGHIPILLLEKVIGLEFDKSDMAPAKYPHSPYFKDLYNQKQLSGGALRNQILRHLYVE